MKIAVNVLESVLILMVWVKCPNSKSVSSKWPNSHVTPWNLNHFFDLIHLKIDKLLELNQILTECTQKCAEHDGEGFVKKIPSGRN